MNESANWRCPEEEDDVDMIGTRTCDPTLPISREEAFIYCRVYSGEKVAEEVATEFHCTVEFVHQVIRKVERRAQERFGKAR